MVNLHINNTLLISISIFENKDKDSVLLCVKTFSEMKVELFNYIYIYIFNLSAFITDICVNNIHISPGRC